MAVASNAIVLFVFYPKFCVSIVSSFSWDHCKSKCGGTNKEYYGIFYIS